MQSLSTLFFRLRLHIKFAARRLLNQNGSVRWSFHFLFPMMSSLIDGLISSSRSLSNAIVLHQVLVHWSMGQSNERISLAFPLIKYMRMRIFLSLFLPSPSLSSYIIDALNVSIVVGVKRRKRRKSRARNRPEKERKNRTSFLKESSNKNKSSDTNGAYLHALSMRIGCVLYLWDNPICVQDHRTWSTD